jgi:hypothetical protein
MDEVQTPVIPSKILLAKKFHKDLFSDLKHKTSVKIVIFRGMVPCRLVVTDVSGQQIDFLFRVEI